MPKGFFLQNPVYMTDYCLFYSGSAAPLIRDQTQKRGCPNRRSCDRHAGEGGAHGMVCELHTSRHAEAAI